MNKFEKGGTHEGLMMVNPKTEKTMIYSNGKWRDLYETRIDELTNNPLEIGKLLSLKYLITDVESWSIEKSLDKADPKTQTLKLLEELGELSSGLLKGKDDVVVDSLGDIMVVLIILHQQLGYTLEETLSVAWNEIKDRKGKTIDGTFIKEEDLK